VPSIDGRAQDSEKRQTKEEVDMLEALVVILVVLWALGFFAFHVGGGLIHALIVIALIILIVRLLKGRKIL
jgi:fatty acid desaturase